MIQVVCYLKHKMWNLEFGLILTFRNIPFLSFHFFFYENLLRSEVSWLRLTWPPTDLLHKMIWNDLRARRERCTYLWGRQWFPFHQKQQKQHSRNQEEHVGHEPDFSPPLLFVTGLNNIFKRLEPWCGHIAEHLRRYSNAGVLQISDTVLLLYKSWHVKKSDYHHETSSCFRWKI